MRVLERRLRRLEVGLLPLAETELRRLHEIVLSIRRRRAARLGLPVQEDVPAPAHRPGVSIGDTIRAGVQHMRALGSGGGRDFQRRAVCGNTRLRLENDLALLFVRRGRRLI